MTLLLPVLVGLAIGGLLGLGHFGGLWLTVRRLERTPQLGATLALSFVLRLGVSAAGFLLAARLGGWPGLLAALAAFLVVRTVAVRLVDPSAGIFGRQTA